MIKSHLKEPHEIHGAHYPNMNDYNVAEFMSRTLPLLIANIISFSHATNDRNDFLCLTNMQVDPINMIEKGEFIVFIHPEQANTTVIKDIIGQKVVVEKMKRLNKEKIVVKEHIQVYVSQSQMIMGQMQDGYVRIVIDRDLKLSKIVVQTTTCSTQQTKLLKIKFVHNMMESKFHMKIAFTMLQKEYAPSIDI
ncbi:hypothetical protein ACJX0J_015935 [Zea mays]